MDRHTTLPAHTEREGERRSLLVIHADGVQSRPLPERGVLTIGRADDCELHIDDPQVSRAHARLWIDGAAVEVEDLQSANGTKVRGRWLDPGARVPIGAGEALEVGGAMLVFQAINMGAEARRLLPHTHFEAQLEAECTRNTRGRRSPFVLLRLSVHGSPSHELLERSLTAPLGRADVLGNYGPGEYELLLLDSARGRGEHVSAEIQRGLRLAGATARVGVACFPDDGITADRLLSAANADLNGPSVAAGDPAVIIADAAMQELYRVVERVASGRISVLLLGETGVGKEIVADAIHQRSPRHAGPFVRFNCAALSESLVEAELFGFEKGAFTGAEAARAGLLEAASGGTLFLDEVGELSLNTQAKLLRVLEVREVRRVGSSENRPVDVRFVSATNRDLEGEIVRGAFREDLYYRLNGVALCIPPLRERRREIAPLARLFARRAAADLGGTDPEITSQALELLEAYNWPGNIRELKNVVERAVLLAGGAALQPIHLPLDRLSTAWSALPKLPEGGEVRRQRIQEALDRCGGNQSRAAQLLGVSRQTLSKWLDRYEIARPRKA